MQYPTMIEELTIERLRSYKFSKEDIDRLTTWNNHQQFMIRDEGIFFASSDDNLIYSGLDGARKYYFKNAKPAFPQKYLDLVPEYYNLKLQHYIEKQKKIAGSLFDPLSAKEDFKEIEIEESKELISHLKSHKLYDRLNSKQHYVEELNWYLKWLKKLDVQEHHKISMNKIDFSKVFPTEKQFVDQDIYAESKQLFESLASYFNRTSKDTISEKDLLEKEINRLESWRDNIDPPQTTFYDKTIDLAPFFKYGWELPISARSNCPNNLYKFYPEIKDHISAKYSDQRIPDDYFEELSKAATDEIILGAANSMFYFWLKGIEKKQSMSIISTTNENIDWLKIFDEIDIEKPLKPKVYKTTTTEHKKNYFSEASFRLTIELIRDFKKKVFFLPDKTKLTYIEGLNIERPKLGNSESELFNQTVYEARNNHFDFLQLYKVVLSASVTQKSPRDQNEANKIDLLHNRLIIVSYFSPLDHGNVKIPMFTHTTNDEFRAIIKEELAEIRKAEEEGNKVVPSTHRSRDIMQIEKVYEADPANLVTLFNDKFNEAKNQGIIETIPGFAKYELSQIELYKKKALDWFPILQQWKYFLAEVEKSGKVQVKFNPEREVVLEKPLKSKRATDKRNFSHKQIAIAYYSLGITIDKDNAEVILKEHSTNNSVPKLLQYVVVRPKDLVKLRGDKSSNTKHLKDLLAAKQLASSKKEMKIKTDLSPIIQAFEKARALAE